jgi:hypothetical protein
MQDVIRKEPYHILLCLSYTCPFLRKYELGLVYLKKNYNMYSHAVQNNVHVLIVVHVLFIYWYIYWHLFTPYHLSLTYL